MFCAVYHWFHDWFWHGLSTFPKEKKPGDSAKSWDKWNVLVCDQISWFQEEQLLLRLADNNQYVSTTDDKIRLFFTASIKTSSRLSSKKRMVDKAP